MTYYHNLSSRVEDVIGDYAELSVYDNNQQCPLLEIQDAETGIVLRQFLQAIIPDDQGNRHIYLALKDLENTVISESLWTIPEMIEVIG